MRVLHRKTPPCRFVGIVLCTKAYKPPSMPSYWDPASKVASRILLITPVTFASAERSFSRLKLIKNILRSTMTDFLRLQ